MSMLIFEINITIVHTLFFQILYFAPIIKICLEYLSGQKFPWSNRCDIPTLQMYYQEEEIYIFSPEHL